jgi:hypothetical protein
MEQGFTDTPNLEDFEKELKESFDEFVKSQKEKNIKKLTELNSLIENNLMGDIEKFLRDVNRLVIYATPGSEEYEDLRLAQMLVGSEVITVKETESELKKVEGWFFINESIAEWLSDYGGNEATRKWVQFRKGEDYEKEHFPKAFKLKQALIYGLDRCEQGMGSGLSDIVRHELSEQGYVGGDGKTAYSSLDNIAEALFSRIESVTPQLLVNSFVQYNGSKYSLRTAQDAIQKTKPYQQKRKKTQ